VKVAEDAALRRAADFVAASGDPLRNRAAAVLLGERPLTEAIDAFEARQRGDGTFVAPEEPSSLAATLAILGLLDDLGALNEPLVERACAQLARIQRDDGSWSDGDPDSEAAALVTTGTLAGILAKTRWVRPRVLAAAGDFLAERWSAERVQRFDWSALAAHAHFFANADHELADEALQWCGRELERGYRQGRFDAIRIARVFAYCDARALPGARIEGRELAAAIRTAQAEDGGWPAPGDDPSVSRVVHSFDALVALGQLS
jgi:hypothetical protein